MGIKVCLDKTPWWYLRYLYADLECDTVGDKVYISGRALYTCKGNELELVEDRAGFPLDRKEGVVAFLKALDYFSKAKIERIERLQTKDVLTVYKTVATLRLANRGYSGVVPEDMGFMVEFLEKPLQDRINYCLREGTPQLLQGILSTIEKALDKDGLKQQHRFYAMKLTEMISLFKRREFKEYFELTDNWRDDLLHLQFLFRERGTV